MPAPPPHERLKAFPGILGFALLYLLATVLISLPLFGIQELCGGCFEQSLFGTALAEGAGACIATALCLSISGKGLESLDPLLRQPFRWLKAAGSGCLAGIALAGAVLLLMALAGCLSSPRLVLTPRSSAAALGGFLAFSLVAVHEELLFRGYPLRRLREALGAGPATLLLAILFGLVHLLNPGIAHAPLGIRCTAILNIFLLGGLFGHLCLRGNSLAVPMGLHLGWNWAQGNLLGFGVSGIQVQGLLSLQASSAHPWLTGGRVGLEGSGLCLGILLGFAGILAFRNPWEAAPSPSQGLPAQPGQGAPAPARF